MSFETLLGNEQLKKELSESVARGQFSHCYLISGPRGSGKKTLARLLAAAILCRGSGKPCLRCHPCRKVMEGSHPDFITWEDPEHQKIPVKLIRDTFRPDVFIKPNESEHKIYMIPQELGLEGQNALLTILEEPPRYAVFLLLADNPDQLLPTVRSRCVELKLRALPDELLRRTLGREFPDAAPERIAAAMMRSGGYLGQARELLSGQGLSENAKAFAAAYAARDVFALQKVLTPMEKWKRDVLIPALQEWLELLEQALLVRSGLPAVTAEAAAIGAGRSPADLMRCCQCLKKAMEYAQGNVSCAAVCGWLTWELR